MTISTVRYLDPMATVEHTRSQLDGCTLLTYTNEFAWLNEQTVTPANEGS